MVRYDTIELLKECNAGIKMGVDAIADVLDYTEDKTLRNVLEQSKEKHQQLGSRTHELLTRYGADTKEPHAAARGMSRLKTGMKMMMEKSNETVADLMTDGCNMGVKSLSRYLNQYGAAEEEVKQIARNLIAEETALSQSLREYL